MKTVSDDDIIYDFEPKMEPVEKVSSGEIVKFEAKDALNGQIKTEKDTLEEIDFSKLNPATGPVYVDGAEKGDILKVKILDLSLPEEGAVVTSPGAGVLGDMVEEPLTRIIDIEDGFCYFQDTKIPINPMIGVIGVAPKSESYSTGTPWKHGGNMDTKEIGEGVTLYFPVNQEGALLALGDCHAVMGDGEVCVSSCEISSDVIVKVDVIKSGEIEWPTLETDDKTMIITSGESADKALRKATEQAVDAISEGKNIDWLEAYLLASLEMDLKLSQIVDPEKTARAAIPKRILETEKVLAM